MPKQNDTRPNLHKIHRMEQVSLYLTLFYRHLDVYKRVLSDQVCLTSADQSLCLCQCVIEGFFCLASLNFKDVCWPMSQCFRVYMHALKALAAVCVCVWECEISSLCACASSLTVPSSFALALFISCLQRVILDDFTAEIYSIMRKQLQIGCED